MHDWSTFDGLIADVEVPPGEVTAVLSSLLQGSTPDASQLALALDGAVDRLGAETTKFQPDIVAIRTRGDQEAVARASVELERIVEQFMPMITMLLDAGAPVHYAQDSDYAIMDAVAQIFSPALNEVFLRRGAELSPGFAERLRGRGRERMRLALETAGLRLAD